MVGDSLGVAILGGLYRAFELSKLHADAAAAQLTAAQRSQVEDAFHSSAQAQAINKTLPQDVQEKVREAVMAALAHGIGGSLKVAAVFSVAALVAALVLAPRGILHKDRQAGSP